jgi:hypothetical protein
MTKDDAQVSKLRELAGPAMLTVTHLFILAALLSFGVKAGGYPMSSAVIRLHGLAVALSLIGILTEAISSKVAYPRSLLVVSLPVFASFLFWLGLGSGGTYPAYHPDAVDYQQSFYWKPQFVACLFAVLFSAVGILYGSPGYLIITGVAQLMPHFGVTAIATLTSQPTASFARPPLLGLIACYLVAALILLKRNRRFGSDKPGLGWGSGVLNALGAACLWRLLSELPRNGSDLSEFARGLRVPQNAWPWTRSAAEISSYATVVVLVALGFRFLSQIRDETRPVAPLQRPWRES